MRPANTAIAVMKVTVVRFSPSKTVPTNTVAAPALITTQVLQRTATA